MSGKPRSLWQVLMAGLSFFCLTVQPEGQSELAGPQTDSREEQSGLLDRANQLITAGRLEESIQLLRLFRQTHPLDSQSYFLAGLALSQKQDWSAAADELKEALRLDPGKPQYTILHANVLTRLANKELAVELLKMFEDPQTLEQITTAWAWLLSDTFFRAGANDDALRVLDVISRRSPEDPRTDLSRGQIYFVQGKHEKALAAIRLNISKQPENNPTAYYELGRTLEQLGDRAGAKEAYLQALGQDAGNAQYLWKLGAICLALGDSGEAIRHLERALLSADKFPEIYYVLGRAYQAAKDPGKAMEAIRKFQEMTAANRRREYQQLEAGKLVGRGEEALDRGDLRDARLLFQRALEKDPDSWAAHGYLAEILLGTGDVYGAGVHLDRMEDLDPDNPVGLYLRARYCYERGQIDRARQSAERVRVQRPGNAELRNLLGNIYLALNRVEEAVEEYRAALKLAPDREDFQLNLSAATKRLP